METPPAQQSPAVRGNLVLAICALALGLIFDYLFYDHQLGISFFLFIALALAVFSGLHRYFGRSYRPVAGLSLLILFFSLMVAVRASPLLTFLNVALVFYLLLLMAREATGRRFRTYLIQDYIIAGIAPLWHIAVNSLRALGELLSLHGTAGKREHLSQVIKGLLMALPVLLLFLLLFASADLAFQKFLDNLVHFNIPEEVMGQVIIIGLIALGSLGAFAYVFIRRDEPPVTTPRQASPGSRLGVVQISVFLGVIDALFLVFILFQLRYLFGGHANITQQGFTYAEYAHRGFFELILIALISLVLILFTERYVDQTDKSHATSFKIMAFALVAAVIVIMVSAFKRLSIYQDAYGFTILRFYVSSFIVWLAVLFAVFGYKVLRYRPDRFFATAIFAGVILFVAVMDIINPEAIIARQNIRQFAATGKVDTAYLDSLSDDAVPALTSALSWPDSLEKKEIGRSLHGKLQELESRTGWQEAHVARWTARRLLRGKAAQLEQYKDIPEAIYPQD